MGPIEVNRDADRKKTKKKEMFSKQDSQQLRDTGKPLPPPFKHEMETKFGTDLSNVKIHDGKNGVRMSSLLGAKAFSHGNHIVFGAGQYQPGDPNGQELLAHELTHVVQQNGQPVTAVQGQQEAAKD